MKAFGKVRDFGMRGIRYIYNIVVINCFCVSHDNEGEGCEPRSVAKSSAAAGYTTPALEISSSGGAPAPCAEYHNAVAKGYAPPRGKVTCSRCTGGITRCANVLHLDEHSLRCRMASTCAAIQAVIKQVWWRPQCRQELQIFQN